MSALHPKVLIIDNDPQVPRHLKPALISAGYGLEATISGSAGLRIIATSPPDAVVLDLDLADVDGKAFLTQIRARFAGPILVLSARQRELDKIDSLDLGADDFVSKPFNLGEVLARLRVAFRRRLLTAGVSPSVCVGALTIDLVARTANLNDKPLALTESQYALLAKLAEGGGKVLTFERLMQSCPEERGSRTRKLRSSIHQLREKIEDDPSAPLMITTERGIGYRLNVSGPRVCGPSLEQEFPPPQAVDKAKC